MTNRIPFLLNVREKCSRNFLGQDFIENIPFRITPKHSQKSQNLTFRFSPRPQILERQTSDHLAELQLPRSAARVREAADRPLHTARQDRREQPTEALQGASGEGRPSRRPLPPAAAYPAAGRFEQ